MNKKPFIFSESTKDTNLLLTELERIGLTRQETKVEYQKEIWSMSCPWKLNDTIQLVWERSFWPDGNIEEDKEIQLNINNEVIAAVDVAILLKQPLEKSLREIIVEKVMKIAMVYTGKKN